MRLTKSEAGASLIDYIVLIAFIALASIIGMAAVGYEVGEILCSIPIIMEHYEWIGSECIAPHHGGQIGI